MDLLPRARAQPTPHSEDKSATDVARAQWGRPDARAAVEAHSAACRIGVPSSLMSSSSPPSRADQPSPLPPQDLASPSSESVRQNASDVADVRRVLHVFSGPGNRIDGLRQTMWDLHGVDVLDVDTLIDPEGCDLLQDDVFLDLLGRVAAGEFIAAIIGIPCSTFSVARIRVPGRHDDGPVQLRDRERPEGIAEVSALDQQKLDESNKLIERSIELARAIRAAGGAFIIENPVTRSEPATPHFRWVWRSHASLWMHPLVAALRQEPWVCTVDFPQCALGGLYQKWTTLMYSSELDSVLRPLGQLTCTHSRHLLQASGRDIDGEWRSAAAAAYPVAMNVVFAQACASLQRSGRLHTGSSKPHAVQLEADAARPEAKSPPTASSIRRLEPEVPSVLATELMPAANLPPVTEWAEAPVAPGPPPAPRTTDDLIPFDMQRRLRRFRERVGACFQAARRGRWKWARDHRPEPLHATEAECLRDGARGWTWSYDGMSKKWYPVLPSKWPDDPPPAEIEAAVVVQYAKEHGYTDMEIISFMAHGYPAPQLERCAVLGPPHVGTLKNPEAFLQTACKDREKGWVRSGYAFPPVWPMRADPMNIVFRNGKPRMTIDKTMELVPGVSSYNACVDLDAQPAIDYVTVAMLGRASAILLTSGLPTRVWGFDLEAYFRKTGKQRRDVWQSGFCHHDGFGVDERVQFGQREAPVLTGRQSCFLVWAVRRELRRLDAEYPCADADLRAWLDRRSSPSPTREADGHWWRQGALFFVLMYVDDVGGVSIDDPLQRADGSAWWCVRDGVSVPMTRAWLHYDAAVGVIRSFGHADAVGKGETPASDMVFLGVTVDVGSQLLSLSPTKCTSYLSAVEELAHGQPAGCGGVVAPAVPLASLLHKLLHASSVIPLGRQHLFHLMRAARSSTRLPGGAKVLGTAALTELRWWADMLTREQARRGVPLAIRTVFPEPTAPGVLVSYSDASREIDAAEQSGYGAWAIVAKQVVYVEGRWSDEEIAGLDINVLELVAMNIGSFTFMEYAETAGVEVTHLCEFTDNTSAEHAAERGKPRSSRLGELVCDRYDALYAAGVSATTERVASADNDVADGLSRGGQQMADALRIAASAGYPIMRLAPHPRWRDTSALLASRHH